MTRNEVRGGTQGPQLQQTAAPVTRIHVYTYCGTCKQDTVLPLLRQL